MKPAGGPLTPLSLPGFKRLAGAYFTNELGNWLGEIALAILVFELTDSPIATAGLFVAMQFVPALTTPLLIARIDAWSHRRALATLYAAEAVAFCALAVLATSETFLLAAVLGIAAIDGTLATAARARSRAAAGTILEPAGLLREGNGILNVGFTAGAAAGPALAGVLVATVRRPGRAPRGRSVVRGRGDPARDDERPFPHRGRRPRRQGHVDGAAPARLYLRSRAPRLATTASPRSRSPSSSSPSSSPSRSPSPRTRLTPATWATGSCSLPGAQGW